MKRNQITWVNDPIKDLLETGYSRDKICYCHGGGTLVCKDSFTCSNGFTCKSLRK